MLRAGVLQSFSSSCLFLSAVPEARSILEWTAGRFFCLKHYVGELEHFSCRCKSAFPRAKMARPKSAAPRGHSSRCSQVSLTHSLTRQTNVFLVLKSFLQKSVTWERKIHLPCDRIVHFTFYTLTQGSWWWWGRGEEGKHCQVEERGEHGTTSWTGLSNIKPRAQHTSEGFFDQNILTSWIAPLSHPVFSIFIWSVPCEGLSPKKIMS